MNVGEHGHRFCPHDIDVTQGGAGDMESCKEGIVRETGVHAVHCCNDIFPAGNNCTGVVHLIDTDRRISAADYFRELPVGKEVPGAA